MTKMNWTAPTGRFPVGVVDADLIDETRASMYATPPRTQRTLTVTCWYPARATDGHRRRTYLKPEEVKAGVNTAFAMFGVPADVQEAIAALETSSFLDAPIADGTRPLVMFCHGGATWREQSTWLMEHLASHGYVVVSVAHPHESATYVRADGEVVAASPAIQADFARLGEAGPLLARSLGAPTVQERIDAGLAATEFLRRIWIGRLAHPWADDLVYVADRLFAGDVPVLAGKLSREVAYVGMSYGAHVASLAAMKDSRARAFVNLDGGIFTAEPIGREIGMPVLYLTEDFPLSMRAHAAELPPPTPDSLPWFAAGYTRRDGCPPIAPVHCIAMRNTAHGDFTDMTALYRESPPGFYRAEDAGKTLALQNRMICDFLDTHVRGEMRGFPEAVVNEHPDSLVLHKPTPLVTGKPLFMSRRHVDIMNRLLADSAATNAAAAALPRDVLVAFKLMDDDSGATHWWQLDFSRSHGVRFGLGEPDRPADLLFVGKYREVVEASLASRGGLPTAMPGRCETVGDVSLRQTITEAFAEARKVATVDVEPPRFPA
jgi:predicted dienelactone hydrolase